MYPRLFQLGHIAIPSHGVFSAIALIAALALSLQTARKLGLDPAKIWNLGLLAILCTLFGSRLLLIVFHPGDFLAHPFWMLGLVAVRSQSALAAALALTTCISCGYIFTTRLPFRRTVDCLAPSLALGLSVRALGALLAGAEYGSPTSLPWGIVYRHALATLWSGTPLRVSVHPVQAYEAIGFLLLFAALMALLNRPGRTGDLSGVFFTAGGILLYFLDFLRGDRGDFFAGAITLIQLSSVAMLLAGAVFLLWPKTRRKEPASVQV